MQYRKTMVSFNRPHVPFGYGLLVSRVRQLEDERMGAMYDMLCSKLSEIPTLRTNQLHFTLLNVVSTHSGMSVGILNSPTEAVLPMGCTLHLTFALSQYRYSDSLQSVALSARPNNINVWGKQTGRNLFVTVGFTTEEIRSLNIEPDRPTLDAIYYLMGVMTKTFVRDLMYTRNKQYTYEYVDILTLRETKTLPLLSVLWKPVKYWVGSQDVWFNMANFLSPQHITPQTLVYYLENIWDDDNTADAQKSALHPTMLKLMQQSYRLYEAKSHALDWINLIFPTCLAKSANLYYDPDDYSTLYRAVDVFLDNTRISTTEGALENLLLFGNPTYL